MFSDIKYVGVNDRKIDLFEGLYKVPNGISYNSYIITDEKIAIMDSVDENYADVWLENIEHELKDKRPSYLIIQHMEPDHSSSVMHFIKKYPDTTVVSSATAFRMMKNYFGTDFADNRIVITDRDELSLGKHKLTFITAPMVHWPEVFLTYDNTDKLLFSADAFGKFGDLETKEDWTREARRYYFGIVGKFGAQVQALLKKVKDYPIDAIYSLHGPVLSQNIEYYVNLYNTWSSYKPEADGIMIAYTSVYGNTAKAVNILADELRKRTNNDIAIRDLARCDMSEAISEAFKYSSIVLATTTYNGDIFPNMREFIYNLSERNFSNRKIGIIENGSWSPTVSKLIKNMLSGCKDLTFCENEVKILSAVTDENINEITALSNELILTA